MPVISNETADETPTETEPAPKKKKAKKAKFVVQNCSYVNPQGAPDVIVCMLVSPEGDVLIGVSDEGQEEAYQSAMASA